LFTGRGKRKDVVACGRRQETQGHERTDHIGGAQAAGTRGSRCKGTSAHLESLCRRPDERAVLTGKKRGVTVKRKRLWEGEIAETGKKRKDNRIRSKMKTPR